jgi:hypothetical protein
VSSSKSHGPGPSQHLTIGTFKAAPGKLDAYVAAYKQFAFDYLKGHPKLAYYSIALDTATNQFFSVSAWTCWDDAIAVMYSDDFRKSVTEMAKLIPSLAAGPPTFNDKPIYCSTH